MDPTVQLGLEVATAVLRGLPALIEAIRKATGMSEEERQLAIAKLSVDLHAASARVAAVTFKDV